MCELELEEGQTLTARDIDKIYKSIKAVIKAAREEVLEGVKITIDTMIDFKGAPRLGIAGNKVTLLKFTRRLIIQDYQLRFGGKP